MDIETNQKQEPNPPQAHSDESGGWDRTQREEEAQRARDSGSAQPGNPAEAESEANRYEAPEANRWPKRELDVDTGEEPPAEDHI